MSDQDPIPSGQGNRIWKALDVVAILILVTTGILHLRREGSRRETGDGPSPQVTAGADAGAGASTAEAPADPVSSRPRPGGAGAGEPASEADVASVAKLFETPIPLPPDAVRVLARGAESAAKAGGLADGFPRNAPGDVLLHGLQMKLFVDDFRLAAHLVPALRSLDPTNMLNRYLAARQ